MENVSQPKVFEFAKEIGMETLALMDKIREWKLPVRSHMAELDPEMLETIRTRLKGGDDKKAAPAKKKVAAKKATPSTATASTAKAEAKADTKAKPPAKKAVAKKPSAAVAAAAAAEAASAAKKSSVVVKKAAPKVVVRKKSDEEEAAELAAAAHEEELQAQALAAEEAEAAAAEAEEAEQAAAAEALAAEAEPEEAPVAAQAAPQQAAPEAPARSVEAATAVAAPEAAAAPSVQAPPAATAVSGPTSGPTAASADSAPSGGPVPSRKREVVMTSQGPSSGIRSDAPRRNIVGRMDLSRVQAPGIGGGPTPSGPSTGSRPTPGGGPSASGPGPRGMGPRPLRTGFVSSPGQPGEVPVATDETRRRFEERRPARGVPAGPAPGANSNAKEKEGEVQHFSSTEFRKREMVFQPKKKKGTLGRVAMKTELTTAKASKRVVKVDLKMKLSDLAVEMGVKAGQLTKVLMKQGVMATMNTDLDFDTIALIAPEFGYEAENTHLTVDEMIGETAFGHGDGEQIERAPVVTIMGHVDHGKTSLLDAIRKARVAQGEAGGITQHIGAYQVTTDLGHLITFIDTPGHEAFTAMRARGANATDIAVIVVAADDGVMPQTIEAVSHAKAAGVPIIVALNKMDKAGANPDRVKQQLTEQQLVPEEWGGDTIYVPVSAHTQLGLPQLLEQIHLVAEVAELRANPKRSATGIVIESRMDKGRGAVATLLVQDGTLKVGQSIVVGTVPGRVRSLLDYKGARVMEAGPSMPVEILGLSEVPQAGDRFDVTLDDSAAEDIAKARKERSAVVETKGKMSLDDIFSKLKQGDLKELPMVLKSDVAGSSEAIKGMLDKVGTSEVKIKLIHSAVGGINESDILLASAGKGIVVGFNVRPDNGALAAAKRLNVEIKTYTIVYEMMDDLKKSLGGLLAPTVVEKQMGRAEVRNTFNVPKFGMIAGCFVTDGKMTRNADIRLLRDNKIVLTGKLASLKRFKDDAKEVATGFECGMSIENYNDIKVGDVIEAFARENVVREL